MSIVGLIEEKQMQKVAFIAWTEDRADWDGTIKILKADGWTVKIFAVPGSPELIPINSHTLIPDGVKGCDILMVVGLGSKNWFVEALNKLNKPTLYLTSTGVPSLDIDRYELRDFPISINDLERALKSLT